VWDGSGSSGGTNMQWYHNGTAVGLRNANNPAFSASPMPFNIGGDATAGEFYQGYIAASHVYNRALSSTEITANFNSMKKYYGY
jgi:hypothetical protein